MVNNSILQLIFARALVIPIYWNFNFTIPKLQIFPQLTSVTNNFLKYTWMKIHQDSTLKNEVKIRSTYFKGAQNTGSQSAFICSKLTIETLEQDVDYVQR